jgi:hypothetical protein
MFDFLGKARYALPFLTAQPTASIGDRYYVM